MSRDTATSAGQSVITVTNLTKTYPGGRGVVDVGFTVDQGEIFGLLGPNGAGKTTTVECMAGLRERDGGAVDIVGHDPAEHSVALREVLGVQLQESTFPDKIRVGEALELYASLYDDPAPPDDLIERLGLGPQRDVAYGALSGGQKQRLSVAVALIGRPRVAILDELTTGLDPQARREVWDLLEDLSATGVTLLLVSHFMEEAQRLCDRVAVIDRGRVVAVDTPSGLAARSGSQVVTFTTVTPVDRAVLAAIESVADAQVHGAHVRLTGDDAMVGDVITELRGRGIGIDGLRVDQPSLDDAFVDLISGGRSVPDPSTTDYPRAEEIS